MSALECVVVQLDEHGLGVAVLSRPGVAHGVDFALVAGVLTVLAAPSTPEGRAEVEASLPSLRGAAVRAAGLAGFDWLLDAQNERP